MDTVFLSKKIVNKTTNMIYFLIYSKITCFFFFIVLLFVYLFHIPVNLVTFRYDEISNKCRILRLAANFDLGWSRCGTYNMVKYGYSLLISQQEGYLGEQQQKNEQKAD